MSYLKKSRRGYSTAPIGNCFVVHCCCFWYWQYLYRSVSTPATPLVFWRPWWWEGPTRMSGLNCSNALPAEAEAKVRSQKTTIRKITLKTTRKITQKTARENNLKYGQLGLGINSRLRFQLNPKLLGNRILNSLRQPKYFVTITPPRIGQHQRLRFMHRHIAGWKGVVQGNVAVHEAQALVLTNPGRGYGHEVLGLAQRIQDSVAAKFGVQLETEPRIYP